MDRPARRGTRSMRSACSRNRSASPSCFQLSAGGIRRREQGGGLVLAIGKLIEDRKQLLHVEWLREPAHGADARGKILPVSRSGEQNDQRARSSHAPVG